MMLRLQNERMDGAYLPSAREYHALYGLTPQRLEKAKPDAIVMHPGPMNRGVEIDSSVADDPARSTITEQVEMGVAVRMACLDILTRRTRKRSDEHTSELQSLMRISYAVFCLKQQINHHTPHR